MPGALDRRGDHEGGQVIRAHGTQGAAVPPDGGTDGAHDPCFAQGTTGFTSHCRESSTGYRRHQDDPKVTRATRTDLARGGRTRSVANVTNSTDAGSATRPARCPMFQEGPHPLRLVIGVEQVGESSTLAGDAIPEAGLERRVDGRRRGPDRDGRHARDGRAEPQGIRQQ